jgi:hypothetical protein
MVSREMNSQRVRRSPSFTASVRLPLLASVGMSRRLLATKTAQASDPTPTAPHHAVALIDSVCT